MNLTPASLPKAGSGFDAAIAVAVLAALGRLGGASAEGTVHVGELGLDGRLRPVPGPGGLGPVLASLGLAPDNTTGDDA